MLGRLVFSLMSYIHSAHSLALWALSVAAMLSSNLAVMMKLCVSYINLLMVSHQLLDYDVASHPNLLRLHECVIIRAKAVLPLFGLLLVAYTASAHSLAFFLALVLLVADVIVKDN